MTKPNSFASSGAYTEVEVRGDSKEGLIFDIEIEQATGKKQRWTRYSVELGETHSWSVDARAIERILFSNVMTKSALRDALAAKKPLWQTADIILPKGTRSIRFHLVDGYTYSDDRQVVASMVVLQNAVELLPSGLTANLGWSTKVYPNRASARASGKSNPSFYFGKGSALSVPAELFVEGVATEDGQVWDLKIECTQSGKPNFFGLNGLDGQVVIDSPRPLWRDTNTYANFKVGVGGFTTVRFAVAPQD